MKSLTMGVEETSEPLDVTVAERCTCGVTWVETLDVDVVNVDVVDVTTASTVAGGLTVALPRALASTRGREVDTTTPVTLDVDDVDVECFDVDPFDDECVDVADVDAEVETPVDDFLESVDILSTRSHLPVPLSRPPVDL